MSERPLTLLEMLLDLHGSIREAFDARGGRYGLTLARARLLTTIGRNQGASQVELASLLGIETPTLKRLLDALEEMGMAERRQSPGDARKHSVHLTDAAQIEPLLGFRTEVDQALAEGIAPEDLETTRRALLRMTQNAASLNEA